MGYIIMISEEKGDANAFLFNNMPEVVDDAKQIAVLKGVREAIDHRIESFDQFMKATLECPICGSDMDVYKEERRTGFLGHVKRYGWQARCSHCSLMSGYADSEFHLRLGFPDWCDGIQRTIDLKGGMR